MINDLRYWCQKVLPLVYEDSLSYYELLSKVVAKINEMISQVNEIPDLVSKTVEEQLNDGTVEQILSDLLAKYYWVNVKCPPTGITPAKGDGSTDDTTAITESITYAMSHEMAVFFPAGFYKVTNINVQDEDSSTGKKISIIGCGSETSIINCTYTGEVDLFLLQGYFSCVSIKGIGINGAGSYNNANKGLLVVANMDESLTYNGKLILNDIDLGYGPSGLIIYNMHHNVISDINIHDMIGHGLYTFLTSHITGNNIQINNLTGGDKYALYFNEECGIMTFNNVMIENNSSGKDIYTNESTGYIYVQYASESTLEGSITDNGSDNEFDRLFTADQRSWTGSIETLQTEIDALPTKTYVDDADAGLQLQIDALPTKTYVDDADAGLQLQIDALPTKTYVDDADAVLQGLIDALPSAADVSAAIDTAIDTLIDERLFNVRDFGAVGDGSTDDTQAFIDCLTYMSSVRGNSKKVMFWAVVPPGKYVITDRLDIPQDMGIRGTWPMRHHGGQEASWLYIKDDHAIPAYDDARGVDTHDYATITLENGSAITDLGIYYPDQTAYNTANSDVKAYRYTICMLNSRSNCFIQNITAINPYDFIYLSYAHDKARVNNIFGAPLHIGINDVRSDDIDMISQIHFHTGFTMNTVCSDYMRNNLEAFIFKGCDWTQFRNSFAFGCKTGIKLLTTPDGASFQGVRHLTCDTIALENASNACVLEGDSTSQYATYDASNGHRDIRFINCIFHGNGNANYNKGYGVYIGYGRDYIFTNCTFRTSNTNVNLNRGSSSTLISNVKMIGCCFMSNSVPDTTQNYGNIDNGADKLIIMGCSFNTGDNNTKNHCIRAFTTARYASIIGNIFLNYSGNVLRSLAGNNLTTCYMLDNIFDGCTDVANAASVITGVLQTGNGSSIKYLDNTACQRYIAQAAAPTHKANTVELYVDASGDLCYTDGTGTKRTISYT